MEYFGVFAFILVIWFWSYPERVKRLERKVKKLENKQRGGSEMSKLLAGLVGKNCKITSEESLNLTGKITFECRVLDCDDEWLKLEFLDPKKKTVVKMLRIDAIESVELASEN